jgi:hypothetical protein
MVAHAAWYVSTEGLIFQIKSQRCTRGYAVLQTCRPSMLPVAIQSQTHGDVRGQVDARSFLSLTWYCELQLS